MWSNSYSWSSPIGPASPRDPSYQEATSVAAQMEGKLSSMGLSFNQGDEYDGPARSAWLYIKPSPSVYQD